MFVRKLSYGYVTNATLEHTVEDVSSVVLQVGFLLLSSPASLTPFLVGISDAYYCAECTRLEKDRDGCPKIVNLGASRTDLFYERRRLGELCSFLFIIKSLTQYIQASRKDRLDIPVDSLCGDISAHSGQLQG